ncbi:hypothetical protein ACVWWG_009407 [Bradyrhizobium sp. LB7.2]
MLRHEGCLIDTFGSVADQFPQCAIGSNWTSVLAGVRGCGESATDQQGVRIWRVVDDKPTAAVLRIWRATAQADGSETEIQELAVFKVTPQESCRVASVDVRQPAANEAARRLASEAARMPCLTGD